MGKADGAYAKVKQGGQYERYYNCQWNGAPGFANFLPQGGDATVSGIGYEHKGSGFEERGFTSGIKDRREKLIVVL